MLSVKVGRLVKDITKSFTYDIFSHIFVCKRNILLQNAWQFNEMFQFSMSLSTSILKVSSYLYKNLCTWVAGFYQSCTVLHIMLDSWGRWLSMFSPWHHLFHPHWWQTWPLPRADKGSRKSCISWSLRALFSDITYREKIPCLYH